MYKINLFTFLVTITLLVFTNSNFVYTQHYETNNVDVEIEKWQNDPEEFARLFYGNDLNNRTTNRGTSLKEEKKTIIEKLKGLYVEWPAIYGIWPPWTNARSREARNQLLDNTAVYCKFGTDKKGLILGVFGSTELKEMLWGIPAESEVILKMKLKYIDPQITTRGNLVIWINGSELKVETTVKRCNWPKYKKNARLLAGTFYSGNIEMRITNENELPVTVGLRKDTTGIDFIVPPKDYVSAFVPRAKYEVYFQFVDDPTNLYKGEMVNVEGHGFEIKLLGKEAEGYLIRKVK